MLFGKQTVRLNVVVGSLTTAQAYSRIANKSCTIRPPTTRRNHPENPSAHDQAYQGSILVEVLGSKKAGPLAHERARRAYYATYIDLHLGSGGRDPAPCPLVALALPVALALVALPADFPL